MFTLPGSFQDPFGLSNFISMGKRAGAKGKCRVVSLRCHLEHAGIVMRSTRPYEDKNSVRICFDDLFLGEIILISWMRDIVSPIETINKPRSIERSLVLDIMVSD
jgi:hypothetical protein